MNSAIRGSGKHWLRWLPGVAVLRNYRREWLRPDLAAGLVLAAMLVPVGVAYAQAARASPDIYGLYASIVPLLAYALFGPSRILVLGPDSALVAVILSVVGPLAAGDPQRAIALAKMRWRSSPASCASPPAWRAWASSRSCCPSPFATAT